MTSKPKPRPATAAEKLAARARGEEIPELIGCPRCRPGSSTLPVCGSAVRSRPDDRRG